MKKKHLLSLLIAITLILSVFLGFYFSIFNLRLSEANSEWGDFGDYFAGTIGICFTLIGVGFMYLTFYEQRKQQFENGFQQYLSNYYLLLNLIKERWLHTTSSRLTGDPVYQTGREIFGNAIGYVRLINEEASFKEIFCIHINVFQHYCNYLVEFFIFLENNKELVKEDKQKYITRFFSMLSVYELTFFAYYIEYIYNGEKLEEIKQCLKKEFEKIKILECVPHYDRIMHIYKKSTGANNI